MASATGPMLSTTSTSKSTKATPPRSRTRLTLPVTSISDSMPIRRCPVKVCSPWITDRSESWRSRSEATTNNSVAMKPGGRGVLPAIGFVAGGTDEIIDILDTNPEVMGTDGLVDEVGRVHVFHGNGDLMQGVADRDALHLRFRSLTPAPVRRLPRSRDGGSAGRTLDRAGRPHRSASTPGRAWRCVRSPFESPWWSGPRWFRDICHLGDDIGKAIPPETMLDVGFTKDGQRGFVPAEPSARARAVSA